MQLTEEEIKREKHLITAMDMPHYPLLPVFNHETNESGIIIAGENTQLPLKVYKGNIWSLKDDGVRYVGEIRTKYECITFPTLEAFLENNWKVD